MKSNYLEIGKEALKAFAVGKQIRTHGRGNFAKIKGAYHGFYRIGLPRVAEMIAIVFVNMHGKHVYKR